MPRYVVIGDPFVGGKVVAIKSPEAKRRKYLYKLEWQKNNRESCRRTHKKWRDRNIEKLRAEAKSNYYKDYFKNRIVKRVCDAARRAREYGAVGRFTVLDALRLLSTQRHLCAVCSVDIVGKYHIDHMTPLSRGGTNERVNIQLLCVSCNTSKAARTMTEFAAYRGEVYL